MDSDSCMGDEACSYAKITGFVENSYNGERACANAAINNFKGPCRVNDISNSCIGFESCFRVTSAEGHVNSISNSCNGMSACQFRRELYGAIGTVADSCVGDSACLGTAFDGEVIENIESSYLQGR